MKYRTLFFSDCHLGSVGSQTDKLLSFLKENEFEYIYAVGDIIDFWALKRGKAKHWEQGHNDVIQKLLRKARKGVKIYYITGNHDEFMEQYDDTKFGEISILKETVHTTLGGKTIWVAHGHQVDLVTKYADWLSHLGSWAYDSLIVLNSHYNKIRKLLGMRYWSLSQFLKHRVKSAVNFIGSFEHGMVILAKEKNADGVICGHIHVPAIKQVDGILYLNCGDWVESISAIVEHYDGTFELLKYKDGEMVSLAKVQG